MIETMTLRSVDEAVRRTCIKIELESLRMKLAHLLDQMEAKHIELRNTAAERWIPGRAA